MFVIQPIFAAIGIALPYAGAYVPLELPPQEKFRIALLTTLGLAWFFWLGAALGSYLNVIVYRMPRGLKSVAPNSRCPKCFTPIRWYDNIPVASWLLLRGRCRACHEPISIRYLVVESIVGSLFVLLLFVDVLSGGRFFPNRPPRLATGLPMIEHFMERDLLAIYAYHAALAWLLVGLVLFRIDRNRIPKRFLLVCLVVAILPPILWPSLRQLPLAWFSTAT